MLVALQLVWEVLFSLTYDTEATQVQKYSLVISVLHTESATEFITKWRLPLLSLIVFKE